MELANACAYLHDFRTGATYAREAIEEGEKVGDRVAVLRARMVAAESEGQIDPLHTLADTERTVGEALGELEALGDERGAVAAMLLLARTEFYEGRCDRAKELIGSLLERGWDLSPLGSRDAAITLLISGYFGTADPDELARIRDQVVGMLKTEGLLTEGLLSMNAMAQASFRGLEAETLTQAANIGRLWGEIGSEDAEITTYQGLGECMRRIGRLDEAERYLRLGVEAFDRLGETGFNSTMTAMLARTLCDLGRWDEAECLRRRGAVRWRPTTISRRRRSGAWGSRRSARIRGRAAEALPLADEAVEIVEPTDYLEMLADAHETRAGVLAALGRTDDRGADFELRCGVRAQRLGPCGGEGPRPARRPRRVARRV